MSVGSATEGTVNDLSTIASELARRVTDYSDRLLESGDILLAVHGEASYRSWDIYDLQLLACSANVPVHDSGRVLHDGTG